MVMNHKFTPDYHFRITITCPHCRESKIIGPPISLDWDEADDETRYYMFHDTWVFLAAYGKIEYNIDGSRV